MSANRTELLYKIETKVDMLAAKYNELKQRQQLYEAMKEENALLKQQLEKLKTAKTLVLGEKDIKQARQTLTRLIKQIDSSIALLMAAEEQ